MARNFKGFVTDTPGRGAVCVWVWPLGVGSEIPGAEVLVKITDLLDCPGLVGVFTVMVKDDVLLVDAAGMEARFTAGTAMVL